MTAFLNGILRDDAGLLTTEFVAPDVYVNGLPVTNLGSLCLEAAAAVTFSDGVPLTAAGNVAVEVAAVVRFQGGWPFTAAGLIAVGDGPVTQYMNGLALNAAGQLAVTSSGGGGGLPGSPIINWDFSDVNVLFQDAAKTMPVTADGQNIGAVQDKGSAGQDWTVKAASFPTYSASLGANGNSCGMFDGSLAQVLTMLGTVNLGTDNTQLYIIYYEHPSPTNLAWFVRNLAHAGRPEVYGENGTPYTYWTSGGAGAFIQNNFANRWTAGYMWGSNAAAPNSGYVSTSDGLKDDTSTAPAIDFDNSKFETAGLGHNANGRIQQVAMWLGAADPTEIEINDYITAKYGLSLPV